jgi:uncharacterized membrane protein
VLTVSAQQHDQDRSSNRCDKRDRHAPLPHPRAITAATRNENDDVPQPTVGEWLADRVASGLGTWRFLIAQTIVLTLWVVANVVLPRAWTWDPYPFILLNLALSFQAAYTAPILLMAANRQEALDRRLARRDAVVNVATLAQLKDVADELGRVTTTLSEMISRQAEAIAALADLTVTLHCDETRANATDREGGEDGGGDEGERRP